MSNANEDLPKVPEPKDGEPLSREYLEEEAAKGKILCVGFEHVQVAQVMALEMVKQGQLTKESLENITGSQIFLRRNGEGVGAEITIVFHGRQPFSQDGFKPSN